MNVSPQRSSRASSKPDDAIERECGGRVVGVDEAGRGPLAGPVVAAAVVLKEPASLDGVNDSKQLTEAQREALFDAIHGRAHVGVGIGSVAEIDRLNILEASLLAMRRAVRAVSWEIGALPDVALVDGNRSPRLACEERLVVGGDGLSVSIAAASIVAKVTRDRLMARLAERHRGFGWEHNRGYATWEHRLALTILGPTPHHRRSFAPLRPAAHEQLALSL